MIRQQKTKLGSNQKSIKAKNRALVLRMICTAQDGVSRIDIARQTGLSKMSITNIVDELLKEGLVIEQSGQPPTKRDGSLTAKTILPSGCIFQGIMP